MFKKKNQWYQFIQLGRVKNCECISAALFKIPVSENRCNGEATTRQPPQNDMVFAVNSACTGSAACPGWQIHIYHCNMVCFLSQRSIKILEEGKQSCRGASTQLNKKGQEEHYQSHKKITFRRLCWSLYVFDQMMKINSKSGRSPTDVLFSSQMKAG